jgi:uncharacterized protein (UPF0332 family)
MTQQFLSKAQENLDDARMAFEHSRYNAVANRAYYAAFQAAIAALAKEGLTKKGHPHDWVQAQFAGVLIKRRKLYSSAMRSYLADMMILRETADYTETMISKTDARLQLKQATDIITSVTARLHI